MQKSIGKIVELTIDMKLNSGQFITESNSLAIVTKIDGFEWQSFMVDPVKSRRFDWTDEIIRSASGDARIQGRFICNSIPSEIEVILSYVPIKVLAWSVNHLANIR